jgi:Ca-activated chloride channel family protein
VLDREKARGIYEEIVRSRRDPALLEYLDWGLFRAQVFPVPARGEVELRLRYDETLRRSGGMVQIVQPLGERGPNTTFSASVKLMAGDAIQAIYSPTHSVDIARKSPREARVSFEGRGPDPARQFRLYYSLGESRLALSLLSYRGRGEDGYFLAFVTPPPDDGKAPPLPKDVVFVLDTSGSMDGGKLDQARKALDFCLKNLNASDRFGIVPFSTEARPFAESLLPAKPENLEQALKFTAGLRFLGGTNIHDALLAALKMIPKETGRVPIVLFLTDGLPTIGETRPEQIVRNAREANASGARLFVFGVGHDVNTRLLDTLAEENRGDRDYVAPGEDLEVPISSLYQKLSRPALADCRLEFPALGVSDLYPRAMPDLFHGSQLTIVGRYCNPGNGTFVLSGVRGAERETISFPVDLPETAVEYEFIPRLWAIRRIGYLLDEIRLRGETRELKDEVVTLGKRHGIATPYTSFLVLEQDAARFSRGLHSQLTPGQLGSSGFFLGDRADEFAKRERGAVANEESLEAKALKAVEAPAATPQPTGRSPASPTTGARRAGGGGGTNAGPSDPRAEPAPEGRQRVVAVAGDKTFYLMAGVWTDSVYDEKSGKPVEVEAFSEEYFRLLKENPALARYLSVGTEVLVVLSGQGAFRFKAPPKRE